MQTGPRPFAGLVFALVSLKSRTGVLLIMFYRFNFIAIFLPFADYAVPRFELGMSG